jgi:hypothetical protein
MQITIHAVAASAILMAFPGAAMAQKSNSAMVAEDMVYRGYRIDFSRVIGHVDLDAAKASLRKQVDIVEVIPLKPAIKDFFRSMRVEVKSELLMESGGQAAGVYRSYYQFVQMIALPSNKTAPVLLHELLHLLFDLWQVLRRELRRTIKIVEEPALGRRTMPQLGLRKKLKHRRRQQMRRRMPVNLQRLGILLGQKLKIGVTLEWLRQIDQIAISPGRQRRIRQPRTDRLRHLQRRRTLRDFLHTPIRELHMNAVSHSLGTCRNLSV